MREQKLYKPVAKWFSEYLKGKLKNLEILVFDAHRYFVSEIIEKNRLTYYFPQYSTFKIKTDILGILISKKIGYLGLVECKTKPITIMDLSQVIGYSKILKPILAIIVSPSKWSSSLHTLIEIFKREDVLEYTEMRKIVVANWDINSNSISFGESLPLGYLADFRFLD